MMAVGIYFLPTLRNRHLLKDRPQSYQHGDYHIGNMMIDSHGVLTIIDFDQDDLAIHGRNLTVLSGARKQRRLLLPVWWMATLAAISRWNSGNCLLFYICSNTLGSLPWAMPFGEGQIQVMRKQAAQVLEWYDGMKNVVPTWYHSR